LLKCYEPAPNSLPHAKTRRTEPSLSRDTAGHVPAVPATLAHVPPGQSPLKSVDLAQPSVDDPSYGLAEDAPAVQAPIGHVPANRSSVGHFPPDGSSIGDAPIGHSSVGHALAEYESFKRATASASERTGHEKCFPVNSSGPEGFGSAKRDRRRLQSLITPSKVAFVKSRKRRFLANSSHFSATK
jgi:hypothetical protein